MDKVLLWIIAAGAVVGGLDYLLGNRLGLGERFAEGFRLLGPTALSMAGILCLAPLLSRALELGVAPLWRALKLDPGMLGGVLAIDMGGCQMAAALAADAAVGRYAGFVVASTLGCTLSFTIPAGMGLMPAEHNGGFFRGLLIGFAMLPAALLPGGLLCGLSFLNALWQTLPVILLSLLLIVGLRFAPRGTVRALSVFARIIVVLSGGGLIVGAVQYIAGVELLPGLLPIEDAMATVSGIGVVMLGSLPAAELLRRALSTPLRRLGTRLGMNDCSLTGLMVGCVSVTPALAMFREMDARGRTVNAAFLVCAASALAAHLGYAVSVDRAMLAPMLLTKLVGGALSAGVALLLTRGERGD